jgi:preprotein translocase subunit SecG
VLVGAVLLQPGKTDAGALFTSNVNSNSFGPRGTATVLSKITIVAAVIFMVSALMISMPALNGGTSVLSAAPETPAEAPATSNSNTDVGGAANTGDNANGALIQTPATQQFTNQAANTASNSAAVTANVNATNENSAAPTATPKK